MQYMYLFQWIQAHSDGVTRGVRRRTVLDDQDNGTNLITTPFQLQMRLNRGDFDLRIYERR